MRAEAWTMPTAATFEKRLDLELIDGSGSRALSTWADEQIVVSSLISDANPDNSNGDSDLEVIMTEAPWIRIIDDAGAINDEFKVLRAETPLDRPSTIVLTGPQRNGLVEGIAIYPWDWPAQPSTVWDHIWGGEDLLGELLLGELGSIREEWSLYLAGERYELDVSLATSGTFTLTVGGNTTSAIAYDATPATIKSQLEGLAGVTTVSVIQPDADTREFYVSFENPKDLGSNMTANFGSLGGTGVLTKLNDGFDTGTDPTFTITVDGQTTTALAWDSSANQVEGTATGNTGLQGLSNVSDVTVSGSGTTADPWSIVFYDPADPTTVTVTFAAGTAVLTKITEGDLDPSPITESRPVDAGAQDTEVHGTYDDPPIEVDTSVVNTGSEYSIKVNATSRFAGTQIVVSVTPGEMLQPSIPLRPTITSDFVLVIHDEFENQIARTADTRLTAGSFTTLSLSDVVIPGGVTRIIMRAAVVDTTPANIGDFYADWQGAELRRGMAEATPGEIVRVLVEAAQDRNTAGFLDISSFSDTQDSAGNNWPSTLSFSAFADHDLGHVLEDLHALTQDEAVGEGYEWRIVHKASPSGGLTHDLELYLAGGAGNAIGDWTDPPSVTAGAAPEFSMVRRVPEFTVGLAHGEGGVFSEKSDSTLVTSFGRWERPFDAEQLGTDATLTEFLEGAFARQASNEKAARAVVTWLDSSVPLTDYEEGDEIYWMFPPLLDREARVVRRVDWEVGEPDRFVVYGSRVLTGEAAMAAALHKYLRDAKRRRRMPGPSLGGGAGGGGTPTVVIAGSDAPFDWATKADFVGNGTLSGDDAALRAAVTAAAGGLLIHAGGTLLLNMANGELELNCSFEGLGLGSYINAGTTNPTFDGEPMMTLYEPQTWVKGLYLEGSGGANALSGVRFQDSTCWVAENYISVSGTSVIVDQESYCVIRDNYLIGEVACIEVDASNYTRIIGNYCEAIGDGIALVSSTPTATIIVGNHFVVSDNAVTATGDNDQLIFTDNVVYGDGGLVGVYAEQIIVANNHFIVTSGSPAVDVAATSIGYHVQIVGNVCDGGGIKVSELDAAAATFQGSAVIADNQILEPYQSHGIELVDSDRVIVHDNIIVSTTRTGGDLNTYDGINLDANCSGCLVHHNQVVTSSDGDWRYGINGPAGNFAVGNQMGTGSEYGTGAFGGSMTLTYPGSGNDNFVA